MKKRILCLCLCVILCLSLGMAIVGCGDSSGSQNGEITIGLIPQQFANTYWILIRDGLQEFCDEVGWTLVTEDPKGDPANQITAVENMISMGVDAIVIAALDPVSAAPVIQQARDEGIIVIAQSQDVDTADIWISADEYDMGYVVGVSAGQWIRDRLNGEAEVAVLAWDVITAIQARREGIVDGIMEYAPNAQIVSIQDANTTELGMEVMENIFQANPNVKVVGAVNDAGALGALAALESSGIDLSDHFVGGIDKVDEAVAKMQEGGAFRMSCDNIPFENGRLIGETLQRLFNGETVDRYVQVPVVAFTQEDAMALLG